MTRFNSQELTNAARNGEGYRHLTPAQAWNADTQGFTQEQLTHPLPPLLTLVFELAERKQRADFNEPANDPRAMYNAAFDEAHPPYVRLPVLKQLREGIMNHLLGLAPPGVDYSDYGRFSLAEVAHIFDTTEDKLLALAEATGTADRLRDGSI
ncbi:hypothetical protein [Vreelandella aquamarina]|uniref:hypothetical protein n=1 Tax=Vreelandella aquamarina TaxID=77097 RepID=UPI00384C65A6